MSTSRFYLIRGAFKFRILALAFCACATASLASAKQPVSNKPITPPSKVAADGNAGTTAALRGIVVIDLTANTEDPDATQVMAFRAEQVGPPSPGSNAPTPGAKTDDLRDLSALVKTATTAASVDERAEAARRVLALAKAHKDDSSVRIFSTKGERVQAVVIDAVSLFYLEDDKGNKQPSILARGPKPEVKLTEKARSLQIVSDLTTLARLVPGILAGKESTLAMDIEQLRVKQGLWLHSFDRTLTLTRSTLTVTASRGKVPVVLALPKPGPTEEEAAELLTRWEALNAERGGIDCKGGAPVSAANARLPYAVLLCAAVVDYTSPKKPEKGPAEAAMVAAPTAQDAGSAKAVDPAIALRVEAIEGLGRLEDPRAIPHLVRLSASKEGPEIRQAALKALSQFKSAAPAKEKEDKDAKKEAEAQPKMDLLTGPGEHWFLSAAVPLTKASAFKIDDKTNEVVLGDEPSAFYLGVNFLLGDLADDKRSVLDNIVLGGLIKASKHPLDSLGFIVGLRGQYLKQFGLNLDVLTPFVGWTYTKEAEEKDGAAVEKGRRNSEFRFGVSLNLDQAAKWFGGGK